MELFWFIWKWGCVEVVSFGELCVVFCICLVWFCLWFGSVICFFLFFWGVRGISVMWWLCFWMWLGFENVDIFFWGFMCRMWWIFMECCWEWIRVMRELFGDLIRFLWWVVLIFVKVFVVVMNVLVFLFFGFCEKINGYCFDLFFCVFCGDFVCI